MIQEITSKLPIRTIIYLLIGSTGILGFVLVRILPNQGALEKIDQNINSLKNQMEKKTILTPLYADIQKRVRYQSPNGLPFPQSQKLTSDDMDRIPLVFQDIAQKSHLELALFEPDINTFVDGSGQLKINLLFKGEYSDFRTFLIELIKIPYLAEIEWLHIQRTQGAKKLELGLRVLLAQK